MPDRSILLPLYFAGPFFVQFRQAPDNIRMILGMVFELRLIVGEIPEKDLRNASPGFRMTLPFIGCVPAVGNQFPVAFSNGPTVLPLPVHHLMVAGDTA